MDPAVWFQEDMIMDCKLRAKNCGGCPMLATEYAAQLKKKEADVRALLGKYAGKVLTYDFIIKELWGPRASGDNQILRVNMANIRRKIEKNPAEPEYLFTEMGVGYRMAEGS